MTPDELTRLRELDRVIAPAPWTEATDETNPDMPCLLLDSNGGLVAEGEENWGSHWFHIDNMVPLLTELRNAIPALLAEIDRLKAEKAQAWEEGRKEGQYIGRQLERTGCGILYKNPYEEAKE